MNLFVERHRDQIAGVVSCFDRVVIIGTLPDIRYAGAMAGYLSYRKIRLFDYPRWAESVRDELRNHAEQPVLKAGIQIEFIRYHKACRKEDRIKASLVDEVLPHASMGTQRAVYSQVPVRQPTQNHGLGTGYCLPHHCDAPNPESRLYKEPLTVVRVRRLVFHCMLA